MSPSAVPLQTTSELNTAGIKRTINKTAPSITTNGSCSHLAELDASKLVFTRNPNPKPVPEPNSPEILAQSICTDHMIKCAWNSTTGWSAPTLEPYGPLSLMPTASVLHYATECFEGMKTYRGYDSGLRIFRPDRNARRMLHSATRIALPAFDPNELQKLIVRLVSVDGEKWLPKSRPGTFLYLRPTMIATAPTLGVQKPTEALLYIIAAYMPVLDQPSPSHLANASTITTSTSSSKAPGMRLLASSHDTVRAWPGGFGSAKVGANYGPSLVAQAEARARGYDQILWLFGPRCEITEAGASNFFVVWRTKEGSVQLVTAPLGDGIILDGVTRGCVLELARERLVRPGRGWEEDRGEEEASGEWEGLEVVERHFFMSDIVSAVEEGRFLEAFATGTAWFITPVSEIHFRGRDLVLPYGTGTP
ncbi:MAG: hypothetical protein Q9187_006294, partial [Circinaria calcarea]